MENKIDLERLFYIINIMPNYENSKIYKLINTDTKDIYIGSTTRDLKIRFNEHKSRYKTGKNPKENSYLLFKDNGNVIIELLENVNCKSKKELIEKEKYYIVNNECVNKYIPSRTNKEYYDDTKKSLTYYHKNKEKINEYRAEKIICECGSEIRRSVLYKHLKTDKHKNFIKNYYI
jgi:hypothetical protein